MEQSACIQPGSNSVPTVDGRSEVGCKSWKCDSSNPGQCYTSRASSIQNCGVCFSWIFLESKSRDQFLLEGRKISDSSAVATAPLQQKDANAISPSLGRNSLPCTTRDPTKSGKAGSKDRNTGPVAAQMLLLLSCLGESVEVSGHGHTSFPALLGRRHTTLSRAYFPCCPRLPATEQHHPVSSTRRLSVKHKCTYDYLGAPMTIYGDFTGLYCISMKANMYSLKFHL